MKFSKSLLVLLVLILSMSTFLVACGGEKEDAKEDTEQTEGTGENSGDDATTEEPVKGGSVTFAMFSAPGGVFNPLVYEDQYEFNVIQFVFESLWDVQDDLTFGPALAETWEWSEDKKDLTVHLRKDVKWHDGEPFTADDVVYTYTVFAHPDYTGTRSAASQFLVGFEEFQEGKTQTFAGVEKVDDYTVIFHHKSPMPNAISNLNFMIAPEHIYKDVPIKDLATHVTATDFTKIVGTGPFKPSNAITNESYELVRNDDYYKGAPYLDKIVWKVVSADVAAGLLETGEIDVYAEITPDDFEVISSIPGVKVHETPDFGYQYMGFLMSKRPQEDIKNGVFDPSHWTPNEKFADKRLRQAMAYAINRQGLVDGLIGGHGTVMNAPMPPVSWAAASPDQLNQYPYDPEKAKSLLAEAGYKDVDGDGFVEDPKGNKLQFKLDYPTGNPVREKSAPIIVENLRAVGLDVKLNNPREAGAHYDNIDVDGSEMFLAGWSLDVDPDPLGIWATDNPWNFPRWNNEESMRLMLEGVSEKAFDQNYRKEVYVKWQQLVNDELPYIFLYSQNSMTAYNTRIQKVQEGPLGITRDIHLWWVKE